MKTKYMIIAAMLAAGLSTQAVIYHGGDITNTTTWVASETHSMTGRVTVLPGATLIIEPGTLIASDGGSLGVAAGAQIFAKGTKDAPIIFTSVNDDFSNWRPVCQEWGSIAICGEGIISSHVYKGAVKNGTDINTPNSVGTHVRQMEGLQAVGDGREVYGGNNDDYDAGTLSYVSIRYGGEVLGEGDELNGLSLGGVGRETQIDHIEIMNNVDDGIEIWGGTVCLKNIAIWNIGDDSLDCDQGWRGKVQYGLIVQGYSADAKQGSGVGDNCIEMDGSEDSDCEPHTTSVLYNMTVIGNHTKGDHGLALRDNVRLQVRNSIFMDVPDAFIDEECDDDGGSGWGHEVGSSFIPTKKGVPTYTERTFIKTVPNMEDTYGVAFNASAYSNDLNRILAAGKTASGIYWAQSDGYMNEVTDTVLYNVKTLDSHILEIEANSYPGWDVIKLSSGAALPIVSYARGPEVDLSVGVEDLTCSPVISLDPRAANDALLADSLPTNDGFFDQVSYRGAFSPSYNWMWDGCAAVQYGMVDLSVNDSATFEISAPEAGLIFSFPTEAGLTYEVKRSATAGGTYATVDTVIGNGSQMSYIDTTAAGSAFYKVVAQ